jgi:DNA-binding LacI/PurR family transcriptional regulator
MSGKLRIKEIADRTGLSISTVSRVLAGKANTSARAKQLVLDCARAYGILEGMSAGRLLFNHLIVFAPRRAFDARADIFYFRMIQGIRSAVEPYEAHLTFCCIEENSSDIQLFLQRLSDPVVEAAIIIGIDDPLVHELAADIGKPCVLLNCLDKGMRLDAVLPDHQQIGEFSANYLIRQGHRSILTMICLRRFTLERRLNGVKDACAANNIRFDIERDLISTSGFGTEEAELAIEAYLDSCLPDEYPSCILAGGDFMAAGIMNVFSRRGISVPDDISVMSMDGFNLASIQDVALTAVHVPREELGQEAVGLLQRRIMRPSAPACNLLVGSKIVRGGSVKQMDRSAIKPAIKTRRSGLY